MALEGHGAAGRHLPESSKSAAPRSVDKEWKPEAKPRQSRWAPALTTHPCIAAGPVALPDSTLNDGSGRSRMPLTERSPIRRPGGRFPSHFYVAHPRPLRLLDSNTCKLYPRFIKLWCGRPIMPDVQGPSCSAS